MHEDAFGIEESATPPLYLVVGDPSRGTAGGDDRRTHLSAWRLPRLGHRIAALVPSAYSDDSELAELGRRVTEIGNQWLDAVSIERATVDEARPEIVVRRDANTPAQWLHGKRVLVLGAGALGALGAPVAEMCVRGGTDRVVIVDRGAVRHGVLVRQPYTDADIGESKATVLAQRLRHIRPDAKVEAVVGDVCSSELPGDGAAFDLIIDATADRIVRTHLERTRRAHRDRWPTLVTLLVGHNATRGIAAIAGADASGGGVDVLRRAGVAARTEATGELGDFADDFFPTEARTDLFQPEPGCSDARECRIAHPRR
jgi:ThiF family